MGANLRLAGCSVDASDGPDVDEVVLGTVEASLRLLLVDVSKSCGANLDFGFAVVSPDFLLLFEDVSNG